MQQVGHPVQHLEPVELKRGIRRDRVCEIFEDFLGDAGDTLPIPWATQDTSAAGSPTLDYVSNSANGIFTLTHDNQSEAQNLTLYYGDDLYIDSTQGPVFEAKVELTTALTADQRVVVGLAAARNATLDSNTAHAWFRMEGANLNILWETDDGTTDDNDNDSGIDWVSGTAMVLRIDCRNLAQIIFYVDGVVAGVGAAAALTGNLQPYIEIQRDAGTETNALDIDYVHVVWDRV
jgi:hypothetical protein